MVEDREKKFQQLRDRVEKLKTQLAEARGSFRETKQRAKEEFNTSSIEELEEERKQLEIQIENTKKQIEKKADELDGELSEIEQQDDES